MTGGLAKSSPLTVRLFGTVALCAFASPAFAQMASSDESGTLVMAAKSSSSVIIAVDSKITQQSGIDPRQVSPPIASDRKLVDLGRTASCAIHGYVGFPGPSLDVATSIRNWAKQHPNATLKKDMREVLEAAGGAWNRRYFQDPNGLPLERKVGSEISALVCGDIENGIPFIVRGETIVNSDLSAESKVSSPIGGDLLYTGGLFDTFHFLDLMSRSEAEASRSTNRAANQMMKVLRKEFQSNLSGVVAFKEWTKANQASLTKPKRGSIETNASTSTWSNESIHTLLVAIFSGVEKNYLIDVAPPNQVRIISLCGRVRSTVESKLETCKEKPSTKAKPIAVSAPH